MSEPIFSTIHGSGLYGLAHEGSDYDVFMVTDSTRKKVSHRMELDHEFDTVVDTTEVGIDAFLRNAWSGSHQSVEALFSRRKVWVNQDYRAMIEGARVGGAEVFAKYERTIKKFCYGDFKRRRHAVRLRFNLEGLRNEGRFNPEMTGTEIAFANAAANVLKGDALLEKLI